MGQGGKNDAALRGDECTESSEHTEDDAGDGTVRKLRSLRIAENDPFIGAGGEVDCTALVLFAELDRFILGCVVRQQALSNVGDFLGVRLL